MLSSISGIYFAGHRALAASVPVPYNDELQYIYPGSVFNGGQTIRSTTSNPYEISAFPTATTSSAPLPAYMIFPSIVSTTLNGYSQSVSPSSDFQRTITMWMYLPTTTVTANAIDARLVRNETGSGSSGIKLLVSTDASKNVTLNVFLGGATTSNTIVIPSYMPKNTWFMLTVSYIINNTFPTSVWYNNTLVYQWTHAADTSPQVIYYLSVAMLNQWSMRFNNYQMLGIGMTQASVNAKFTAERAYYGV